MSERDRKIIKDAFNLDVPGDGAKPHNSVRHGYRHVMQRRKSTPPLKAQLTAPQPLQESKSHSTIFIIITFITLILFNLFYME